MIKDTYFTLVPINWFLRITALSNIYRKGVEVQTFGSKTKRAIYVLVLTFVNLSFLYLKLTKDEVDIPGNTVKFSTLIQMFYWFPYCVYIIDLFLVHKYCGNALVKFIKTFDAIDQILGKVANDEIHKTIIIGIFLNIGVYCFTTIFDYGSWTFIEGWQNSSIYAIDYVYLFLNILTILDAVSHIVQVEFRLKIIQGLLENQYGISLVKTVSDINQIKKFQADSMLMNLTTKLHLIGDLEITTLIKCYLQLLEQVNFVNTSYGFRVVVHFGNMLFNVIQLLNVAIRPVETLGEVSSPYMSAMNVFLVIASSILRAINYEFIAIMLVYRCEQAYKHSDKILETIDVLLTGIKRYSETKNDLLEFRHLLLTRPIKFHAAKFFTIDYRTLVSLNSVVVTYTIIMRQNI